MSAQLLAQAKEVRDDGCILEIAIWRLPQPLPPCRHIYQYRPYYGAGGVTRVRYDNERGKGDHRHIGDAEEVYASATLEQLIDDFRQGVEGWR